MRKTAKTGVSTARRVQQMSPLGISKSPLRPLLLGLRDFTIVPVEGHAIIKRGISSQIIELVSQYLGLGKGALAEFMDLDRSTVTRLAAKGQMLPAHAAETILRLLEIHDMAANIFATEADASAWLRTLPFAR